MDAPADAGGTCVTTLLLTTLLLKSHNLTHRAGRKTDPVRVRWLAESSWFVPQYHHLFARAEFPLRRDPALLAVGGKVILVHPSS
jgi:hypothetical protein